MKKVILSTATLVLVFFVFPAWSLSIHTFISEYEPNEEIYSQYEAGTLDETMFYTVEDVTHGNGTYLGFLFDLDDSYPETDELYVDLNAVYDGISYEIFSNVNYSSLTENYNGSSYNIIRYSSYDTVDLSLHTGVTFTGYYGDETVSSTMYLGEQPVAAPVPEPATVILLATGLIGMLGIRRKI